MSRGDERVGAVEESSAADDELSVAGGYRRSAVVEYGAGSRGSSCSGEARMRNGAGEEGSVAAE